MKSLKLLPLIDRSHVPFLHAILAADTNEHGYSRSGSDRDDLPKLVYADRLEDWGFGQRAEFIRCQVWLERNLANRDAYHWSHSMERALTDPGHPNYGTPAAALEREMLSPPKESWDDRMYTLIGLDGATAGVVGRPPLSHRDEVRRRSLHFCHGFLDYGSVRWPDGWSLAQVAALFARQPVREVNLWVEIPGARWEWVVRRESHPAGMNRGLVPDDLFALMVSVAPKTKAARLTGDGREMVFTTRTLGHKVVRDACREANRLIREAVWADVEWPATVRGERSVGASS